ncbi:MAG: hypothetical protein DSY90_08210 [Deltaproteobacteria bacterium]|nr:MAG: hypothetical protein DSY90_08210 [Deltaproteobacteria bacterium]
MFCTGHVLHRTWRDVRHMNLKARLEKHKDTIIDQWFDRVVKTYPADTAGFLKNKKDPFANPVRNNTLAGMNAVVTELLGNGDHDVIRKHLDPAIRIRAVQQFTPAEAVGIIFFLKPIIRNILKTKYPQLFTDPKFISALWALESEIDGIGLIAFDIYVGCREKIYDLKATVERNTIYKAFHRAGLVVEDPEDGPDIRPV